MNCRSSLEDKLRFYDRVIADDINYIMYFLEENTEDSTILSNSKLFITYDDTKESKYLFRIAKLVYMTKKDIDTIYVDTSRKEFKKLREINHAIPLKKANWFNKRNQLIFNSKMLETYHQVRYKDVVFETDNLSKLIWEEYYEE